MIKTDPAFYLGLPPQYDVDDHDDDAFDKYDDGAYDDDDVAFFSEHQTK